MVMARVRHGDDDVQTAVELYRSGVRLDGMGGYVRASGRTVRGWVLAAGVELRVRGRRDRHEISKEVLQGLIDEGLSVRGMGRCLGVSAGAVDRRLERYGMVEMVE